MDETLSLIELLKIASLSETIIVGIILLPAFLGLWAVILNKLQFNVKINRILYAALVVVYISGIAVLKLGESSSQKLMTASIKVKSYLEEKGWEIIGFNRIRERIEPNYSDEFLLEIIQATPKFEKILLTDPADTVGILYNFGSKSEPMPAMARNKILDKSEKMGLKIMGFQRIRNSIDSRYSNEFLEELCDKYDYRFERIALVGSDSLGMRITH